MGQKVVIVGAGIGGLALANILQKAGCEVHVYEKNRQLGGRAGQKQVKGFTYDTGPSWYLMPKVFEHYFSLFDRSAQETLELQKLRPAYKVFYESRPAITISGNLVTDRATFDAIEPGSGEALSRYVAEGNDIYQFALRYFLYTNFSSLSDFLKKPILQSSPRLLKLLVTSVHQRARSFVHTRALQQILEYPMVFLGTSPFNAPAMYSLMSALDFKEGVYYPKNGIYAIITALTDIGEELGVTYHTGKEVVAIEHVHRRATGIRLATGHTIPADIVVSNADLHFTETALIAPEAQSYPEAYWHKKESGISALLLYLGVKGSLPALEHHNLFFVDNWKKNFDDIYEGKQVPTDASLYVSKPTSTDPGLAPEGHENLFVLMPLPTGVALSPEDERALADRCINQLAVMTQQPDLADRIVHQVLFGPKDFEERFNAWQGTALGMSHKLTQSAFWRTPNVSKRLDNLFYVGGNTTPGIGLPMCLISAELVYKRIMGDTRGGKIEKVSAMEDE